MTRIQCVATFFDDLSLETTQAVTLTIQGQLDAVTNLASTRDPFMITWEPPFSLNLTDVEPDIAYCIDIVLNCNEEVSVISDCNVTTNYYDAESLNPGYTYNITVTPKSNVDNALVGLSSGLDEKYVALLDSFVSVSSITLDHEDLSITIHYSYAVRGNIVEPATYTLSLKAIDREPDPESFLSLAVTKIIGHNGGVALKAILPRRRLWLSTAFPNNCTERDQAISKAEELSTHYIQNVSITPFQQTGEVQVFGDFVTGTSATGALVIIYSNQHTRYHLAPRGDNGRLDTAVPNLPGGAYKVSVFTIEENGVPFERVVTSPISVNVSSKDNNSGLQGTPHIIEYELRSATNSDGVNITCFFLYEFTTDCVVVVHSVSSTLTSNGVMNISSYLFIRSESEDSVSGHIDGVNLEGYQFGVIGGELRDEDIQTNSGHACEGTCLITVLSFGTITAGVSLAVLSLTIVYFIRRKGGTCFGRNELGRANEAPVELKRCAAYEVTSLSRKKVVMKENPAYECVTLSLP